MTLFGLVVASTSYTEFPVNIYNQKAEFNLKRFENDKKNVRTHAVTFQITHLDLE
jgi:hypothetical protein